MSGIESTYNISTGSKTVKEYEDEVEIRSLAISIATEHYVTVGNARTLPPPPLPPFFLESTDLLPE